MSDNRYERYSDLVLKVGANLQRGQALVINADVEHAPLVRVMADRAWRAGAGTVFCEYRDAELRKSLVDLAPEDALTASPPGSVQALDEAVKNQAAFVRVVGDPSPELLAKSDPARSGRAMQRDYIRRWGQAISSRDLAWTVMA